MPEGPSKHTISPSFSIFKDTLLTLFLSLAAKVTLSICKNKTPSFTVIKA